MLLRFFWNILPLSLVFFVVGYTLIGEEGLLTRHALKQELYFTNQQVDRLNAHNQKLEDQIRALREDPDAVRRLAAERLLLAAPGSVIYRFEDE